MSEDGADRAPTDGSAGLAALGALARIPSGINAMVADIRAIAEGMRILPELARILGAIEQRVDSLDEQVIQMRQGVDRVNSEVGDLGDRLEPHLMEVRRSLRPLRRVAGRITGRRAGVEES